MRGEVTLDETGELVRAYHTPGTPAYDEGARELEALLRWASGLDSGRYDALLKRYMNQPNHPPQLITVKRKRPRGEK